LWRFYTHFFGTDYKRRNEVFVVARGSIRTYHDAAIAVKKVISKINEVVAPAVAGRAAHR